MCSIRNMGGCPCPRCLIPMENMHLIGTKRDAKQMEALARVDNASHQIKVSNARQLIYESNFAVDSAAVERLLKPESLVPTEVSYIVQLHRVCVSLIRSIRMPSQNDFPTLISIFFLSLWLILCMRWNWESGSRSSCISSEW